MNWNIGCYPPETARTTEVVELQWNLDVADDDITLINRRLDEVQGMSQGPSLHARACYLIMALRIVY